MLKAEVEAVLRDDPRVDSSSISVRVDKGAVSLFGEVCTYASRVAAADVTKGLPGVRSVTLGLIVRPAPACRRSDESLQAAASRALRCNASVPSTVRATVDKGWITLRGEVRRSAQRDAAEDAVSWLDGVVGVSNTITADPECSTAEVEETLRAVSARRAHPSASP